MFSLYVSRVLSNEDCKRWWGRLLNGYMICNGDSGGPLAYKMSVGAIVSQYPIIW